MKSKGKWQFLLPMQDKFPNFVSFCSSLELTLSYLLNVDSSKVFKLPLVLLHAEQSGREIKYRSLPRPKRLIN